MWFSLNFLFKSSGLPAHLLVNNRTEIPVQGFLRWNAKNTAINFPQLCYCRLGSGIFFLKPQIVWAEQRHLWEHLCVSVAIAELPGSPGYPPVSESPVQRFRESLWYVCTLQAMSS